MYRKREYVGKEEIPEKKIWISEYDVGKDWSRGEPPPPARCDIRKKLNSDIGKRLVTTSRRKKKKTIGICDSRKRLIMTSERKKKDIGKDRDIEGETIPEKTDIRKKKKTGRRRQL